MPLAPVMSDVEAVEKVLLEDLYRRDQKSTSQNAL